MSQRDPNDPLTYVHGTVTRETRALMDAAPILLIMGGPTFTPQLSAHAKGLKLIMERFPEIDWGTAPKTDTPPANTTQFKA